MLNQKIWVVAEKKIEKQLIKIETTRFRLKEREYYDKIQKKKKCKEVQTPVQTRQKPWSIHATKFLN